MSLEQI